MSRVSRDGVLRVVWPAALTALAALAILIQSGCGGPGSSTAGGKEDTLARIKREGVLKWGADPSGGAPFVFTDPENPAKSIGFEVDIMEKVAGHIGVKQEIVRSAWDMLLDNMRAGRSDMVMNGIEINEERKKKNAFTQPYYLYEQQLTVRADDKDKYKSLDDLKGRKIATLSGAEANNVLKDAGWTIELLSKQEDSLAPYKELEVGRADAALQESIIAAHYAGPNPKLYNIPQTFSPGKYAVAVRPEDKTLLAEVDRVLTLMKQNGELAAIYKKWKIWNEKQKELEIKEGK